MLVMLYQLGGGGGVTPPPLGSAVLRVGEFHGPSQPDAYAVGGRSH